MREIVRDGQKIICYVKVRDYIIQMDDLFGCLDRIAFIVDEFSKNHTPLSVRDYQIPVYPVEQLCETDWQDHALVITSEYYWEVFDTVKELRLPGLETAYYFEDKETAFYQHYIGRYATQPLQERIVLRSGPRDLWNFKRWEYNDNAKALYDHLIAQGLNRRYRITWLVCDPRGYEACDVPDNVDFLSVHWSVSDDETERERYYEAICLSKYFFFTEAYSFVRFRREGQLRVQLWHGQGFKTRMLFTKFGGRFEYNTVISELYARIHLDIFRLTEDQIAITGIPKQDWVFHPVGRDDFLGLGIPAASHYIFWLPTLRDTFQKDDLLNMDSLHTESGFSVVDTESRFDELNAFLEERDCVMVVKLHPAQRRLSIMESVKSNIVFLDLETVTKNEIHINQIMAYADGLIADFSTAIVDYLLLDRPIALAASDLEEVRQKRGFCFDNIEEWLPGEIVTEYDHFCSFIDDVCHGTDATAEKRRGIIAEMFQWRDDRACERILNLVGIAGGRATV